jgi:transposase
MKESAGYEQLLLDEAQMAALLQRVQTQVSAEDYRIIEGVLSALAELVDGVQEDSMTMRKLRLMLFGPKTEKTARVCAGPESSAPRSPAPRRKRPGHGRRKARDYTGAHWIQVAHPRFKPGDRCPGCSQGTLRAQRRPGLLLRIQGSPPIAATGFAMERLRCDGCGQVFTAPTPPEAGTQKYDPSVGVTVALLRYGSGMPHYRLERLQQSLGVPLPASTQWELIQPLAQAAQPIWEELIGQAANAPVIHHDDTTVRVLDLRRSGSPSAAQVDPERKGTFTTNILAEVQDHSLALFFTGWQHAGENLAKVLHRRATDLDPPIQMCDALSRNLSPKPNTILAYCLSHGRREIVSVADKFPEEGRHVLESLGQVYHFDAQATERDYSPEQRLLHHQTHSRPVMEQLKVWMQKQFDEKRVEPNSGLGQAMNYLIKYWEPLTLFLRQPGAPLDNNKCERALKMAILHRKNSLSYKTQNGAQTGDLFMSLIHTCRLNRINPFDYLLAIATHPDAAKLIPSAWLPWNYPKSNPAPSP